MKCFLTFCLFGIATLPAFAQQMYEPAPLITEDSVRIKRIEKKAEIYMHDCSGLPERQVKYIKKVYDDRFKYYKSAIGNGYFLINSTLEKHCANLLQEILKFNPRINKDTEVFISRSSEANAFTTGDGNLVVNVGLLNKLNNDAGLIFILCHELAHQELEHVKRMVVQKAAKYTDDDFLKAIKKAEKEEFQARTKLESLVSPMIFSDRRYSRSDEYEADSLGLIYFLNTGYDPEAIADVFGLLNIVDKYHDTKPLSLRELLDAHNISSKEYWFSGNKGSSLGSFEEEIDSLADSLKTHPDTDLRIQALRPYIPASSEADLKYLRSASEFNSLKLQASGELIYSHLVSQNLSRAMFEAFILLRDNPENDFSRVILSMGFSRLYHLQITHRVQTEVHLPDQKNFEKCYNDFIAFLNQIKKEDVLMLAEKYLPAKDYDGSEIFLAAKLYYAYNRKDEKFADLKSEYLQTFPKGWFIDLFTSLQF